MPRNVKRMSDHAFDLLPENRQLVAGELNELFEAVKADKYDGLCMAFYFGVAVCHKAIKDGALKI